MKKTIAIVISLFIFITFLTACSDVVTIENMKKTLEKSGYTINEDYAELYEPYENSIKSVGGFSFVFPGAHGNIMIPILEFQDSSAAVSYAEIVNSSGDFWAVVNGTFLIIVEAHHGIAYESQKIFFENLINGRPVK
jgi:hypothetical protein